MPKQRYRLKGRAHIASLFFRFAHLKPVFLCSMSQLSLEQQEAIARVIANLNQSVAAIQSGAGATFVPVTSAAYTERLDKALLKNFDYIRRYGYVCYPS